MKCNVSDKLYIDRTAAIMTAMNYDGNGNAQDASQDIASALGALPAAEVAPVRHGEWVDSKLDGVPSHCSECNYPIERFYKTHFCPNCGADMREVRDGKEVASK